MLNIYSYSDTKIINTAITFKFNALLPFFKKFSKLHRKIIAYTEILCYHNLAFAWRYSTVG